jgi:trimeric autotransporter adhesin
MGRFVSAAGLAYILINIFGWVGCGSSNPTHVVTNPIPASVSLCLSPSTSCSSGLNESLEVGQTLALTATARNVLNQTVTETFSFQSSNTTILTIANNGLACAGTWNSLTAPTVCTPGPSGIAQIIAVAQGVSSPPVTVYVHQHITSIVISPAPIQPALIGPAPPAGCLSKGAPSGPESFVLEATAKNGSTDITASVGPFSWGTINPTGASNILSLSAPATSAGSPLNQQIVTAASPGLGRVYASASSLNSQPFTIETCRIQSISISAAGNPPTNTFFVVNTGTSTTLNATVTDSAGMTLTGVPLTWSTSNPVSVGISGATSTVYGSVGTASSPAAGAAAVIASCTPPTCNGGIKITTGAGTSSLPIYPDSAISFVVRPASTTTASPTAYATTTACSSMVANPTNATCNTTIVPISRSSSTSSFTAGSPVILPSSPNSILFDNTGSNAYLGVNSSNFGQKGVMVFNGSSASQFTGAPGRVLAISPETMSKSVVISDTGDSPNQLFICTNCGASSRTLTSFLIDKAAAAAFSPDGLKGYIVTASHCPGQSSPAPAGCLLVYSKVDAPKMINLSNAENDITFFPEGGAAYSAIGTTSTVIARHTCDNSAADTVTTAAAPAMVRALPDNATVLVLAPPFIQLINVASTWAGCTPAVNDTVVGTFNLGQGSFTPTQLIVSPDGTVAYILGEASGLPFPFIMVFDIQTRTSSLLSLANNAVPLSAGLSPAGDFLFVGANDEAVHVIDTTSGLDTQQVTFPFPSNELCYGPGSPPTRVPLSQVTISAAAQSGSNITYTYSLISGPSLQLNQTMVISNMADGGNDGTFTITALGTDSSSNPTFTVSNSLGVNATGQSGTGTVPITCNPDLVAVKP